MGGAGGELCDAIRRFDGKTIAEHAQFTIVLLEARKDFPGSFHRHQAAQQAGGFAGLALGCVGVAAVDGTQRVAAQIPDGGAVGSDGVPDAGQLRHNRRQAGQRTPGGGHDHDAVCCCAGDGFAGKGSALAAVVQQRAVQIQCDKTDRGKILRHKGSF